MRRHLLKIDNRLEHYTRTEIRLFLPVQRRRNHVQPPRSQKNSEILCQQREKTVWSDGAGGGWLVGEPFHRATIVTDGRLRGRTDGRCWWLIVGWLAGVPNIRAETARRRVECVGRGALIHTDGDTCRDAEWDMRTWKEQHGRERRCSNCRRRRPGGGLWDKVL